MPLMKVFFVTVAIIVSSLGYEHVINETLTERQSLWTTNIYKNRMDLFNKLTTLRIHQESIFSYLKWSKI